MFSRYIERAEESETGTIFRDLLLNLLAALTVIILLLFILPKQPNQSVSEDDRSRGNIRVEVIWPPEIDVDVDTWVKAPGLPAVGYSNMNGPIFNLVRDDLGTATDITGINYENAFSRGIPPGEYVINVHLFANRHNSDPVPVNVLVTIRKDDSADSKTPAQQVLTTTLQLTHEGQELTVIRFMVDENGDFDRSSMNDVFKSIRAFEEGNF